LTIFAYQAGLYRCLAAL